MKPDEFSDDDQEIAKKNNFLLYVSTPAGILRVYPSDQRDNWVNVLIPMDREDPDRQNSIDSNLGPKDEPVWGWRDEWDHFWGDDN